MIKMPKDYEPRGVARLPSEQVCYLCGEAKSWYRDWAYTGWEEPDDFSYPDNEFQDFYLCNDDCCRSREHEESFGGLIYKIK